MVNCRDCSEVYLLRKHGQEWRIKYEQQVSDNKNLAFMNQTFFNHIQQLEKALVILRNEMEECC